MIVIIEASKKKQKGRSIFFLDRRIESTRKSSSVKLEGKTRMYQFNPRYPFLKKLKSLLGKAYTFLSQEFKNQYYEPKIRKRPRTKGNPL